MAKSKRKPAHGDLEIWWVPQVPMKAFRVPVANLVEAKLLLDALANYDLFQLENNVKLDYANAGGLQVYIGKPGFDDLQNEWVDWLDEHGETIDHYTLDELRKSDPVWEFDDVTF